MTHDVDAVGDKTHVLPGVTFVVVDPINRGVELFSARAIEMMREGYA